MGERHGEGRRAPDGPGAHVLTRRRFLGSALGAAAAVAIGACGSGDEPNGDDGPGTGAVSPGGGGSGAFRGISVDSDDEGGHQTFTMNGPPETQQGDLLIAHILCFPSYGPVGHTIPVPEGWSQEGFDTAQELHLGRFWRTADGASDYTWTAPVGMRNRNWYGFLAAYRADRIVASSIQRCCQAANDPPCSKRGCDGCPGLVAPGLEVSVPGTLIGFWTSHDIGYPIPVQDGFAQRADLRTEYTAAVYGDRQLTTLGPTGDFTTQPRGPRWIRGIAGLVLVA
jgi:hypothetical protein